MVTDRWYDPIEVILGSVKLRIGIEINRDHQIAILVQGLVEVHGNRIYPVIEVIDREDQFMLIPGPGSVETPVQGHIKPVIVRKPVIISTRINGYLVILIVIEPCRS